MDDCIKEFYIPAEAWYKNIITGNPEICIGFYSKKGGTAGEFEIEWDDIGIRLHVYNGSWEALSEMPELIALMAKYDREKIAPDIKEFAEQLKEIGFKDITEREKEETSDIISESWKEIKIIINSNINELCNQNRYSDAKYLENCRDAIKMALMMNGYKID